MAINPSDLGFRTGDTGIAFGPTSFGLSVYWEGYHLTLGDVIGSGSVSQSVAKIDYLAPVYDDLMGQAAAQFATLQVRHKGIPAIGGLSPHDVDLVLDSWMFAAGTMKHPISGEFSGSPVGLVATVNAIVALVLPPTTWAWAKSEASGALMVKYVAVAGASSYNVYNGTTLLGSVTGTGWKTLSVADGQYSVRIAPVASGGTVGICSFPIPVTVGVVQGPAMMPESLAAPVVQPKKLNLIQRYISGQL